MQFAETVLAILDWILEDTALMLCKDTRGSASTCDSSLSAKHTFANTQRLQQPINEKFVFQQLTIMMYLCARLLVVCNVGVGPKDVAKVIEVCHQRTPSQARENLSVWRGASGKPASPTAACAGQLRAHFLPGTQARAAGPA